MKTLRERLIDELTLSNYSDQTIKYYQRHVERLAEHYGRSPDKITPDEIRDYLAYLLREKRITDSTLRVTINALVFFYDRVLQWPDLNLARLRPKRKKVIKRPKIYSVQEIERLLSWEGLCPKYRTFIMTTYAAGLRVSEICHLKPADILADRHQIRVVQGKGKKDRFTVLFPKLLSELRSYWRLYRPEKWLFPSARDPQVAHAPAHCPTVLRAHPLCGGLS